MKLNDALLLALSVLALSACAPVGAPLPMTPPGDSEGAAVVRRPLPEPTAPGPGSTAGFAPAPAPAGPGVVVPAGSLYVCASESGGVRQETAIQFAPKVAKLCAKHPEMGPCQYERDICRRSGGRVYAAGGIEITPQTEAEYDKKVLRVRFKSN